MFIHFKSDETIAEPLDVSTYVAYSYFPNRTERLITFVVDDEGAELLKRMIALIGYAQNAKPQTQNMEKEEPHNCADDCPHF